MLDSEEPWRWQEPPERIAACMQCQLPDCNDRSSKCLLRTVQVKKQYVPKPVDMEYESNRIINEKLKLTGLIRAATGMTMGDWCKSNGLEYNQILRFERYPPKQPTKLSTRIEHLLKKDGIIWTGHHCNTH